MSSAFAAAAILGADATGATGEQYLALLRYAGHQQAAAARSTPQCKTASRSSFARTSPVWPLAIRQRLAAPSVKSEQRVLRSSSRKLGRKTHRIQPSQIQPIAEVRGVNVHAKQLVGGRDRRRLEPVAAK